MNTQIENKSGFANNLTAQILVLTAVVAVLLIVGVRYMW